MSQESSQIVGCRLLVPDGSMKDVIAKLLADAGMPISYAGDRSYEGVIRSVLFPEPFNVVRRLRPWDAPWIIADRKAELAFTSPDLVAEAGCEDQVVIVASYPLSRAGFGGIRLVIAVPPNSPIRNISDLSSDHELITEYPNFANRWLMEQGVNPRVRACHGSLEAYAGIADAIFETVESGASLRVAGFTVIAEVIKSQCCLITNPAAWENLQQHKIIEQFKLLLDAVMAGRGKSILKCNVLFGQAPLSRILAILPAVDQPTVSNLANKAGFAVEAVVATAEVPDLILRLKKAGATSVFDHQIGRYAD